MEEFNDKFEIDNRLLGWNQHLWLKLYTPSASIWNVTKLDRVFLACKLNVTSTRFAKMRIGNSWWTFYPKIDSYVDLYYKCAATIVYETFYYFLYHVWMKGLKRLLHRTSLQKYNLQEPSYSFWYTPPVLHKILFFWLCFYIAFTWRAYPYSPL